jgi:hypothetical protein
LCPSKSGNAALGWLRISETGSDYIAQAKLFFYYTALLNFMQHLGQKIFQTDRQMQKEYI